MAAWCGWVLVGVAALTPLMAWLGPLGFAPLVALAGLLCLPALRIPRDLRMLAGLLAALVAWALLSMLWSTHRPDEVEDSTGLKLALQLPLYAAAWAGARRADPRLARLAARVLAFGLAGLGVLLLIEAFTQVAVYRAVRQAIGDPIAFEYARKNVAQACFVLALLWPVAGLSAWRVAPLWLALPMAAGAAVAGNIFLADAPVLAVGAALAVAAAVLVWPTVAPRALGTLTAGLVILMPPLELALRVSGLGARLPLSWSERVGYWNHAVDRIMARPFHGWGLDSSRDFSPLIVLHPHNGPLQIWLELGAVGAALAALAWAAGFRTLATERSNLSAAGAAASAAVYVLFGLVSFGVWQEWWLALGALVLVVHALQRQASASAAAPAVPPGTTTRPRPAR